MKNLNILVLDKNVSERKTIVENIKSINHFVYNIIEVSTLKELHSCIEKNNIDLILLNSKNYFLRSNQSIKNLNKKYPEISKIFFIEKDDHPIVPIISENISNDYLIKNNYGKDDLFKSIFKIINWNEKLNEINADRNLLYSVFNSLCEAVVILDKNGQIYYGNKSWAEFSYNIFSSAINSDLNDSYFSILQNSKNNPTTIKEITCAIEDLLLGKIEHFYKEYSSRNVDNQNWYSIKLNSFSQGKDIRIVAIHKDITKQKEIEFELIENKIKQAEKTDRLKSEFLTQISHEIRTPLNSLLGFAQLIKEEFKESISDEWEDAFNHMDAAGKRIFRTIELLIKISELHTENYEPEYHETNLIELLDELVKEFKPLADKKNLEFKFMHSINSKNLKLDKKSVIDVFSNLIDNAIKFTNEGSVKIFVKPTLFNKVLVQIKDTGIGISEKFIGNIFHPFSQETCGYTRKFDGNGLGLALVKQYCELNKAEIFVSSQKGTGTSFTVIF
jgi:signal transduction histidine kinase